MVCFRVLFAFHFKSPSSSLISNPPLPPPSVNVMHHCWETYLMCPCSSQPSDFSFPFPCVQLPSGEGPYHLLKPAWRTARKPTYLAVDTDSHHEAVSPISPLLSHCFHDFCFDLSFSRPAAPFAFRYSEYTTELYHQQWINLGSDGFLFHLQLPVNSASFASLFLIILNFFYFILWLVL